MVRSNFVALPIPIVLRLYSNALESCLKLAVGSNRSLKLGAQPFAQVQGQIKRCIGFRSWHCAMGMGAGQLSRFCNGHEQYVGERVPLAVQHCLMSKVCLEKSRAMNNCDCELLLFLTVFFCNGIANPDIFHVFCILRRYNTRIGLDPSGPDPAVQQATMQLD